MSAIPASRSLWTFRHPTFPASIAGAVRSAPLALTIRRRGSGGPGRRYSAKGALGPNVRRRRLDDGAHLRGPLRADHDRVERTRRLLGEEGRPASWRPRRPPFQRGSRPCFGATASTICPETSWARSTAAPWPRPGDPRSAPRPGLAAFAWRAPASMKVGGGETKRLLRRVLYRYVPRALIDRPKMGFSVPLHEWLTGGLRGWAEDLSNPGALNARAYCVPRRRPRSGEGSSRETLRCNTRCGAS